MIDSLMGNSSALANLRCRDGDIALVVKESPICSANVGKLVRVRGPARTNWKSCVFHEDSWLLPIRPEIPAKGLADTKGRLIGRLASLPQRAKAGQIVAADCTFDFAQLDEGTRFFDWEDMPITTDAEMTFATAWTPMPSPRNPSDVRNKAGELTMEDFEKLYFCKAFAWANWPPPYALKRVMEENAQ